MRMAREWSRVHTLEASPYLHSVGPGQGLLLVGEVLDGDGRAEELFLDHLVVLFEPGDHRGGEEVATVTDLGTSRHDLGTGGLALEEAVQPFELVGVVEGPEIGVGHVEAPNGLGLGLLDQGGDKLVVDLGAGQHPSSGGAVLAGVEIAGHGDALGRCGYIGVVEDDDRRLASELEMHSLDVGRCGSRHFHAGPHAAGHRHHGRRRVLDQQPSGVAVTTDHVEDAVGQVLGHDLGHEQGRDGRGVGRLQHHGVASRQCGSPFPCGHHHRVVPGGHCRAHSDGLTADVGGVVGHVLAG